MAYYSHEYHLVAIRNIANAYGFQGPASITPNFVAFALLLLDHISHLKVKYTRWYFIPTEVLPNASSHTQNSPMMRSMHDVPWITLSFRPPPRRIKKKMCWNLENKNLMHGYREYRVVFLKQQRKRILDINPLIYCQCDVIRLTTHLILEGMHWKLKWSEFNPRWPIAYIHAAHTLTHKQT